LGEPDPERQAAALDVGAERRADELDACPQLSTAGAGVAHEIRPLDLAEHGVRGACRERVAAERRAVVAGPEELGCGTEGHQRADRETAADTLRERDGIRNDSLMLEG